MQKGMRFMLAGLMAATLLAITPAAFAGGAKTAAAVMKQGTAPRPARGS